MEQGRTEVAMGVGGAGLPPLTGRVRLVAREAMVIARAFVSNQFRTPNGYLGLWSVNGEFWVWAGGRWVTESMVWVENRVWRWLERATYVRVVGKGEINEPVAPDSWLVKNVVRAIEAITERKWSMLPVWTSLTGLEPDARKCLGFEDCVVSVDGGEVKTWERDERWLDNVQVPCKWEPGAQCPRWMRCLEEWSNGDPEWAKLAQAIMGMALFADRRLCWLPVIYGVSRSGKGTYVHVMRKLMGGRGWFSTSVTAVTKQFGLDGINNARVMNVAEYGKGKEGAEFERILKEIVSQEEIVVDVKHVRAVRLVPVALPILQSNKIPEMANDNQGITSKMVILPFERTFMEAPQLDLKEVLEKELPGIAAWAVEGARRLAVEGQAAKLVVRAAHKALLRFKTQGNVLESFLEARYEQADRSWVLYEDLWATWRSFLDSVGYQGREKEIGYKWFPKALEEGTSWQLRRDRVSVEREDGKEQVRVLMGLRRRRVENDELL